MNEPAGFKIIEIILSDPEKSRVAAELQSRQEAVAACAKAMKTQLGDLNEQGLTAEQLFDKWRNSGFGYRIEPEVPSAPFSDVDFARLFVMRLTNDYSHPLYFEFTIVDCFRTAYGVTAPARTWKFWLKAPATYKGDGLQSLMQAGVESLYEQRNIETLGSESPRYLLIDMKYRPLNDADAKAAMSAEKDATVYYIQNDGSFAAELPANPLRV